MTDPHASPAPGAAAPPSIGRCLAAGLISGVIAAILCVIFEWALKGASGYRSDELVPGHIAPACVLTSLIGSVVFWALARWTGRPGLWFFCVTLAIVLFDSLRTATLHGTVPTMGGTLTITEGFATLANPLHFLAGAVALWVIPGFAWPARYVGQGGHGPEPAGYHKFLDKYVWRYTPDAIWKAVFSTDHKVIGIQYAVTGLVFLLFGFSLMMMMRLQLAYPNPGHPAPPFVHSIQMLFHRWLASGFDENGYMVSGFYNQLGAMHGTIMVFLGVVPLAVGGFGNFVVPLQIGAPDMAFPRLNMASYWSFFVGGVIMFLSFFVPGGAAQSGWTSYAPLSDLTDLSPLGQTWWGVGMVFLITSSLLGSINIIVTIVQMRAPGLTMFRLPFFVWAQLVTSFLLVLAFPPLEGGTILQLMDRIAHTSFFLPSGLVVTGHLMHNAGGGNPLLWQHLFWFLAHPEVYVLILPAMGIVGEVIANNTRKPLWGYRSAVYAIIFLGFMSFVVWAHHMFMTGMGTSMSTFFQTTTMIISVPSVIILTVFIISLYGGAIRYTVPMLFALFWMVMFAIGGLTGLPLGLTATDLHLHDTYYVIGHFHYVVAPGTIFGLFAGIYYWYPKATGRQMNQTLGKLHFWISAPAINLIFFPMLVEGMLGVNRRLFDQTLYSHGAAVQGMTVYQSWGAWILGAAQLIFIYNFFVSLKRGERVAENPWASTTLEWSAPSPPPHGNFVTPPRAYRGPYEYSVPGAPKDFSPQFAEAT